VLDNGILIAVVAGGICTLFISLGMSRLFRFFSDDQAVVAAGSGYLYYRLLSGLPFLIVTAHRGFFNGIGRTNLHMRVVIVANVFNVCFNYLLIFGRFGFPRMEAAGAGLGTTLANVVGMLFFIAIALKARRRRQFKYYQPGNIDLSACGGIVRLAVPSGLQVLISMAGYAVFNAIIARIGTIELASTNVCITIWSVAFMPGMGIGVAAATLIGQKLGEGKPARAAEYGWESVRLGTIVLGSIGVLFLTIPGQIFEIFTEDMAVIASGKTPLRILGLVQIFDATGMVMSQALQGAGMNRWVMFAEIATNWGFFIPGTLLVVFVFKLGLNAAWVVLALYLIIFGLTVTLKFAGGKWKTMKV